MVTQERLKELLDYDSNTGMFRRKASRGGRLKGTIAGTEHGNGYWKIRIDGRTYFAHRLVWLYITGKWPKNQIDHIDHCRYNNRFENLRAVTHQENGKNQKLRTTNTSGAMGVSWDKTRNKWAVAIKIKSKLIHLGRYKTKSKAISIREMAEILYDFHENHGAL